MASATMPSGTVTFLFTDIEGSTQRWERHPAEMRIALRRHDTLLRDVLTAHGGHVFKTIGDAFCAAFARVPDALAAALAIQRALAAQDFSTVEELRVRIALHTGSADERDGDYFGPTLNIVARLLSVGHGEQILVSTTAAGLLARELPGEVTLVEGGVVQLREIDEPQRVFVVSAPGLRASFPPLRSLAAIPNNLPLRVLSFVGRQSQLAELHALLRTSRLVTIAGTGGIGKTQSVLQLAAGVLDAYPDGVWFVELAALDANALVPAVVAVLGLPESPKRTPLEVAVTYLRSRRTLLILDNCEHVVEAAAAAVGALLQAVPQLHIVVTSRQALRVSGETVYQLPALDEEEAVALFVQRAQAANRDFALTPATAPIVREICRSLDGMALAIELAAARVRVLSPSQLAQRLDERLRLLGGGRRTDAPRQQTMHALIDWSYQLLDLEERRWFRALSIFAESWTLESALAVGGGAEQSEWEALDAVSSLVEKSLVVSDGDTQRYRMLETLRAFGRHQLGVEREDAALAARHIAWMIAFSERNRERDFDSWGRWRATVAPELAELRAAMQWAAATGDFGVAARLAVSSNAMWIALAPRDGLRWIETLRASNASFDGALEVELFLQETRLLLRTNRWQPALASARRAMETSVVVGDAALTAEARCQLATALVALGHFEEAEREVIAARDAFASGGDGRMAGRCLGILAVARDEAGDFAASRKLFEEAMSLASANGADREFADLADNFSVAADRAGERELALAVNGRALAARHALADRQSLPVTLNNRAQYLIALERYDEAEEAAREAGTVAEDLGSDLQRAYAFIHRATVAVRRGEYDEATSSLAAAQGLGGAEGDASEDFAALRAEIEAALGPGRVAAALEGVESLDRPA